MCAYMTGKKIRKKAVTMEEMVEEERIYSRYEDGRQWLHTKFLGVNDPNLHSLR